MLARMHIIDAREARALFQSAKLRYCTKAAAAATVRTHTEPTVMIRLPPWPLDGAQRPPSRSGLIEKARAARLTILSPQPFSTLA